MIRPVDMGAIIRGELRESHGLGAKPLRRYEAQRHELKHRVPASLMADIREFIAAHVEHDRHCAALPEQRYTVRSIYFDTDDLAFYFEKMDSVKIRKKLRIRTYNAPEDAAPAFLEIKRKYDRLGSKDRFPLPMRQVEGAINGKDPSEFTAGRPFSERKALDRFRFNLKVRQLRPVVLVTYEREAFVGRDNERVRVTFDQNLRSLGSPELAQIFSESDLRQWEDDHIILELKFDDTMPRWMARMIRLLNLRSHAYSKYCHGIDAWQDLPK